MRLSSPGPGQVLRWVRKAQRSEPPGFVYLPV